MYELDEDGGGQVGWDTFLQVLLLRLLLFLTIVPIIIVIIVIMVTVINTRVVMSWCCHPLS